MSDQNQPDDIEGVGSAEEPGPQGDWDPSALPIWATIRETAQAIAKEWKALLKAIVVPALLLAGVTVEDPFPNFSEAWWAVLMLGFSPLFFTMIAVPCHRLLILGVHSLPNTWGVAWSHRETRFLAFSGFFLLGGVFLVGGLLGIVGALLGIRGDWPEAILLSSEAFWVLLVPVSLTVMYLTSRSSLVLAATAVGQHSTFITSWQLSRSNGWRLVLVIFLPQLLLLPVELGVSRLLSGVLLPFLLAFAVVLWGVLGIASLSRAFCWFTGEIEHTAHSGAI